jgi:hypothetical protein
MIHGGTRLVCSVFWFSKDTGLSRIDVDDEVAKLLSQIHGSKSASRLHSERGRILCGEDGGTAWIVMTVMAMVRE